MTIPSVAFSGCVLSIACTATSATVNINNSNFIIKQGMIQTVLFNGEKWIGLYPTIGEIKVRYADQPIPSELYIATVWENISDQYAGKFFRSEGGNAASFGQSQSEGLPNITGTIGVCSLQSSVNPEAIRNSVNGTSGCFKRPYNNSTAYGIPYSNLGVAPNTQTDLDASLSNNIYGKSNHVTPENSTIQLWRRTA